MSLIRVCHERVLPAESLRPQPVIRRNGASRAVFEFRKMWVNGSTLRVRFMGGTKAQREKTREQAAWWTEHANLTFDFNDAPDAEIRIAFDKNDGAWSWVGTDCRKIPNSDPTMNLGFMDGGTVAHEFGHAIGLGHEHQNPSGGMDWNEDVVLRDLAGPPNNWARAETRHNVLQKYRNNQIRGTEFDGKSIMLYFFPDNWVRSGKGTRENDVLSDLDKQFIASADAYPRDARPTVDIKIGASTATRASIGQPGEEDLFRFTVKTAGRYVIRTGGKSDVVMKLFGPDSATRLIAEDDDSGVGANARIIAALVPGRYVAQVRHVKRAGTGAYTIKVDAAKT